MGNLVDRHTFKMAREQLSSMIKQCNYRGHVNERLALHLKLPYVANTARLPFLSRHNPQPLKTSTLPEVLAMDDAYVTRAAHAKLLRGKPLVLPVFLALVLDRAARGSNMWTALAEFRESATGFRKRRAELDHALDVGDQDLMDEIQTAICTDAKRLTKRLSEGGGAAVGAAVTSLKDDPTPLLFVSPLDWLKPGLSAAIAGAQKLIPPEVARRLIWRLFRPELRFISDITMESRAVINSLPNVKELWKLPDADIDLIAKRIDTFRTGLRSTNL